MQKEQRTVTVYRTTDREQRQEAITRKSEKTTEARCSRG